MTWLPCTWNEWETDDRETHPAALPPDDEQPTPDELEDP